MREREDEINRNAVHDTQRRNELSSYGHSTEAIIPMLRRNVGYTNAESFPKIERRYLYILESTITTTNRLSFLHNTTLPHASTYTSLRSGALSAVLLLSLYSKI